MIVGNQKSIVTVKVTVRMNRNNSVTEINLLVEKSKDSTIDLSYDERLLLLEDAHLLSQPYAMPHFFVHWEMFKLAFNYKQCSEALGQMPRLILAMPGSWLGMAPRGNVGSTKMGIFEEKNN